MPLQRREIAPEKTAEQLDICERIRLRLGPGERFAMVDTYGCQQNESDSEILRGFLRSMGYSVLNLVEIRKPYANEKLTTQIQVGKHSFDY